MRGDIFLSPNEARRVYVMEQVLAGKVTIAQAALVLGLCGRQVKRLKGGMLKEGAAFLAHKNRGLKPKNALSQQCRDQIISRALGDYRGASCEQMAELLMQYQNISVSSRTIRRMLAEASIPNTHSHKTARRRRTRDRMPKEGMLVQCDASPFEWLENRGPEMSLHGIIDDATSEVLGLYFRMEEDTIGYMRVLMQMLINYGVPCSFYSDRHTIFFSPKMDKLSIEEELAGKTVNLTQFGRSLDELQITHIPARSPQAKGRIERLWETLQGRLVIELRLAGISDLESANAFLPSFLPRFNERFAVEPADPEPAFRPAPSPDALSRTVCFKEERKASNGSTISFLGNTYRLIDQRGNAALLYLRSKVTVLTQLDGSISALCKDKPFSLEACSRQPSVLEKHVPAPQDQVKSAKPVKNDQWSKFTVQSQPADPVERYFGNRHSSAWRNIQLQR
jgi:transposase